MVPSITNIITPTAIPGAGATIPSLVTEMTVDSTEPTPLAPVLGSLVPAIRGAMSTSTAGRWTILEGLFIDS
ncbi:hypothetical protein PISMIDRAFT_670685, partial [Pisolithus microcarpus 441]